MRTPAAAAPAADIRVDVQAGASVGAADVEWPAGAPHLLDASMFWTASGSGGVHRVIATKRAVLGARGWRHTLLAPGVRGPGTLDCGGVPIPASGGYRFVVARHRAARLIEQAAPDIVEAADPYVLGWAVRDATARLGVPAVAFCHSNLPQLVAHAIAGADGTRWRSLARAAERHARSYLTRLYEPYALVLAPSRSVAQQLHDAGVRQAQVQPLGVDCATFTPAARDPDWAMRLRLRLGLPPETRLLLYAGRFAPEKNLGVLADALRLLGPGHVLLAVGAGPRPPAGDHVRLLKPESDTRQLARLIASCDVFVHAGNQETFGLAALEAMACGTPLVTHAAAGLGELVDGAGTTLDSLRALDWAEAIAACLASTSTAVTDAALQRARAHDWQVVLGLLEHRYRQAMRRDTQTEPALGSSARSALSVQAPLPSEAQVLPTVDGGPAAPRAETVAGPPC